MGALAGCGSLQARPHVPRADHLPSLATPRRHTGAVYNASTSETFRPRIDKPVPAGVAYELRRAYYASVSWMDFCVGRLLDELKALDLESRTIVAFHSDHGFQLGEHNSWAKFTNFELGTRVPLLMRAPMYPGSSDRRTPLLVELVDVFPTLADLAGVPLTGKDLERVDGVSLAPVFRDPSITSIKTDKGTEDKTLAFSQFPHNYDFGCPFYRDGLCYEDGHVGKQGGVGGVGRQASSVTSWNLSQSCI